MIASMAGLFVVGGATFDSLATGAIIVVAVAVHRVRHGAARAAGQARPLGRPSPRPAAVAGQPSDRTGRDQPPPPGARRTPPGRRAGPRRSTALVLLAVPSLGMKTNNANLDTLPAVDPPGADDARDRGCVPVAGHHGDGRRARPRRRAGPLPHRPAAPRDDRRRHARLRAGRVDGAIETSTDGQTQRLTLPIRWSWSDQRATQAVQHLRDQLVPDALGGPRRRARRRR